MLFIHWTENTDIKISDEKFRYVQIKKNCTHHNIARPANHCIVYTNTCDALTGINSNMENDNQVLVRLYRNLFPVARCQARYIGLLGMQIDSGPLHYPKGTQMEIELSVNGDDNVCRIPAVVTNLKDGEMGLSFLRHDMKTNAQLLNIIASLQNQVAQTE